MLELPLIELNFYHLQRLECSLLRTLENSLLFQIRYIPLQYH